MKYFFILLFFVTSIQAEIFRFYPVGEKSFESKPLQKAEYNFHLAQLESLFFIVEFSEGHDFKKHSPIFDIATDTDAPVDFNLYWLLGHPTRNGEFADDIVVPVNQENLYQLPHENFPRKKLLLVEIKGKLLSVPKFWQGNLTLTRLDTKSEVKIPLKINLHKFVLPSLFQLKTSFGFAPWTVYRKHNITPNQEDALYNAYFALAREHRMDLHKIYIEFSKQSDGLLMSAQNPKHSFLSVWKQAQGADESYTRMQTTDLPVPPEMKKEGSKNEAFWKELNKEAKNYKNFFVYFEDEPTPEQIKDMIPTLKSIKSWAPDIKLMMTTHWTKDLDGLIDIWCPNLINWNLPQYPTQKKYEDLKKKGNELWVYVSCNSHGCKKNETTGLSDFIIERNAATLYSFPWIAETLGAQGILYYDTVRGYLESDMAPYKDPKIFNGMGEGNLFYPCSKNVCGGTPTVFPSLRMKILRSSLESLEIVKTAMTKDKKLQSIKENISRSPRYWSRKISDYEDVKKKALEILDAN